jgi:hypothetical protein
MSTSKLNKNGGVGVLSTSIHSMPFIFTKFSQNHRNWGRFERVKKTIEQKPRKESNKRYNLNCQPFVYGHDL